MGSFKSFQIIIRKTIGQQYKKQNTKDPDQSQFRMPPYKKQQEKLPMLLFLLQHKKHHQLIKSIYNQKISKSFLSEYGYQKYQFSKIDEFKLNQDALHFTIEDLIQIKGSNDKKVKRFQNVMLIQTILKKLRQGYEVERHERKMFWVQFTQIYSDGNLYDGLEELELPPDTQAVLDKDIKRTYYNLPTKDSLTKQKNTQLLRQSLKQSLSRFALYNPFLLYCQGMNQIFGFLYQQGFTAKQSFFVFKRITQVLLPTDYYSSLQGIVSYLKILWEMIAVSYPKIHHKLNFLIKQMDFSGSYLCVFSHVLQWFVCLFTNTMLDRQVRRIIMDYFLLEGITVMFKASLAIFQYLEETILKVNSFESYVMKVEQAVRKYDDVTHLRKILNEKFISKEILFLMKQYSTSPQQQSQKKFHPFTKKCYKKWNFCLQQLQNNFHSQHKYDFFVFKRKSTVKIIPDYLIKLNTYYFQKKKTQKPTDLLNIGRIPHVCRNGSEQGTEDSLSENTRQKQSPFTSRYSPTNINITVTQPTDKSIAKSVTSYNEPQRYPNPKQFTQCQPPNQATSQQQSSDLLSISELADNDQRSMYRRQQTMEYREQLRQKLLHETERKSLQKSESMMFMKMMVDNQSYSNLFSLLENQEMDKMFDINSDSGEEDQIQNYERGRPYFGVKKG